MQVRGWWSIAFGEEMLRGNGGGGADPSGADRLTSRLLPHIADGKETRDRCTHLQVYLQVTSQVRRRQIVCDLAVRVLPNKNEYRPHGEL